MSAVYVLVGLVAYLIGSINFAIIFKQICTNNSI